MCVFHKIKRTALFLIAGMPAINAVSAQAVLKVGENPGMIMNSSAVLEIESTSKGILLPRMSKTDRNAISVDTTTVGLQVWCKDCNNGATASSSGEFCVYLDKKGWTSLKMFQIPTLTTDAVTKGSLANSAFVTGTLVDFFAFKPTENGIVYREITDNDFQTLPVLDASGNGIAPNYKLQTGDVTAPGGSIKLTIPGLTGKRYYFRTYAKNIFGIGYGKPLIFNFGSPVISTPIVSNGNTQSPTFSGTLTVSAGTPKGTITEYGYCSGTDPNPTTNKVALSTSQSLDNLNAVLGSDRFVIDPTVDLAVNNYTAANTGNTYFRYYVVANGATTYSDVVRFSTVAPVDPVTRSTAVALVTRIDPIVKRFQMNNYSISTVVVHFDVTKAGEYKSFIPESVSGATLGLTIAPVPGGYFPLGDDQTVTFVISGSPINSNEGNTFMVPGFGISIKTGGINN